LLRRYIHRRHIQIEQCVGNIPDTLSVDPS
jgi:hypothetical protein